MSYIVNYNNTKKSYCQIIYTIKHKKCSFCYLYCSICENDTTTLFNMINSLHRFYFSSQNKARNKRQELIHKHVFGKHPSTISISQNILTQTTVPSVKFTALFFPTRVRNGTLLFPDRVLCRNPNRLLP